MSRWTRMLQEHPTTLNSILWKCIASDYTVQQIAHDFETDAATVYDYINQHLSAIAAGRINHRSFQTSGKQWTRRAATALQTKYGITVDDYNEMYQEQQGCCKICGKHEKDQDRRLVVDHCHKGGQVRGLLCVNCNLALGLLEDDPNIMKMAIIYLEGRL